MLRLHVRSQHEIMPETKIARIELAKYNANHNLQVNGGKTALENLIRELKAGESTKNHSAINRAQKILDSGVVSDAQVKVFIEGIQ